MTVPYGLASIKKYEVSMMLLCAVGNYYNMNITMGTRSKERRQKGIKP